MSAVEGLMKMLRGDTTGAHERVPVSLSDLKVGIWEAGDPKDKKRIRVRSLDPFNVVDCSTDQALLFENGLEDLREKFEDEGYRLATAQPETGVFSGENGRVVSLDEARKRKLEAELANDPVAEVQKVNDDIDAVVALIGIQEKKAIDSLEQISYLAKQTGIVIPEEKLATLATRRQDLSDFIKSQGIADAILDQEAGGHDAEDTAYLTTLFDAKKSILHKYQEYLANMEVLISEVNALLETGPSVVDVKQTETVAVARKKAEGESASADSGEGETKKKRASRRKGGGGGDGTEPPDDPADETVGGSINTSSLTALLQAKENAPVVSSASVTVDTSGPTPEPSTLVVPKSAGETPASQGEIPQGQERESSKLDEVLEQWRADVQKRIEGINTPEAYAEFRDGMTKPDRIGKRHFFALSDVKSAAGIIELSPVPSKKIADTEKALEDLTRAKFEALVKADLDAQYDREQEKIDGAKNEAELDALVAGWVQSPNVVLTWKDFLTKLPDVEQKIINQQYRGCSEELSENVRQKREFFKQEARIAEERRPLTLFLERPIGERCVVKYRKFIKDEWQKFFDALRYEVVKNKKKDLPWKKKIEEWNAFYLPEVKKIIVGHIAKQKGMTEADGEAIFLILLRDLDEEFSEKKKRS
jgi:hypothetical protein